MQVTPEEQRQCGKRLWSKEEDQLLRSLVTEEENPKWAKISKNFNELWRQQSQKNMSERTNKQCRERWQNHLNPHLKNSKQWTIDEHRALFRLFRLKSHKWCDLSKTLQEEGFYKRSDNNIKNYFYSTLKRQVKRINEVIKEHNKQIKKIKSQKHNYSQRYAYKQRLSLQRQVHLSQSIAESNEQQSSEPKQKRERISGDDGLHIIKELEPELISKILLIAEDKANRKYIISSNSSDKYQREAEESRNRLIDLIIEMEDEEGQRLDKEDVLNLAKGMLDISRKCKKKTNSKQSPVKMTEEQQVRKEPSRDEAAQEEDNNRSSTQKGSERQGLPNEQLNHQQFMRQDDDNEMGRPMGLLNSQFYKNNAAQASLGDVCFNPFRSFDFSNVFRSGEMQESGFYNMMNPQYPPMLCLSNSSFLNQSQNIKEKKLNQQSHQSFIDNIRVEEKRNFKDSFQFLDNNNTNNNGEHCFSNRPAEIPSPFSKHPNFMQHPHPLCSSCPVFEGFSSQQMPKFQTSAFDTVKQEDNSPLLYRSWVYPDHPLHQPTFLNSQEIKNNGGSMFKVPQTPAKDTQPLIEGNLFNFPPEQPQLPKDNNDLQLWPQS